MTTWTEKLSSSAPILGIVLTSFLGGVALGYPLGKDTNDGLTNFLREKNQAAEQKEKQLVSEITALKLELQSKNATADGATLTGAGSIISGAATATGKATGSLTVTTAPEPNTEEGTVSTGTTREFFGGKVSISLRGISFEGDPIRHRAILTIGSTGKDNLDLNKVDVGYLAKYNGYEIRVLATDTFTAKLAVIKSKID